jgi:hypothetical protein
LGKRLLSALVAIVLAHGYAATAHARDYALALQGAALAPNAGGQEAWALRFATDNSREYSIFANEYLRTGDYPLVGAIYSFRFPIFSRVWPIYSFVQIGAGASSAGPVAEFLMNLTPAWVVRIDFSTHFYAIPERVIVWNYPFWVGLTVPF